MKVIFVLTCVIGGGFSGYQAGLWWLHRTVESPELESAVYPGIGTMVGSGLVVGFFLLWLRSSMHRAAGPADEFAADEGEPSESDPQRRND
ncbi:MAG: hypothetical protein M3N53_06665 [Actinomycetota bacterium]|nr:hypothetical protein [Actinomycetota bacterium]